MNVYDVMFNKGLDVGSFLVVADNADEAEARVEAFLGSLTPREYEAVAGRGWEFHGVSERYVVDGIVL